jgi:hypothetical protein
MLTACTAPSSGTASAPTPTPAPSAINAQTPSASPTPQFACDLPYLTTNGQSLFTAVGFLKLPGDVFSPDPTAGSALPPGGVQASPVPGAGATQPWWDAQARRWVPVDLSSVSPDGQSYVYLSADGLHRVLVATGADQLVIDGHRACLAARSLDIRPTCTSFSFWGQGWWRRLHHECAQPGRCLANRPRDQNRHQDSLLRLLGIDGERRSVDNPGQRLHAW